MTSQTHRNVTIHELECLLHRDRSALLLRQPFTAGLAMRLAIVVVNGSEDSARTDPRITTAATDGRTLYFDAAFTAGLDARTRQFVLCHEVWHCVMGHLRRRFGRDHQRWNRAIDYEVNAICGDLLGFVPETALHNEEWNHLSAEDIYALLKKNNEPKALSLLGTFDQHLPLDPLVAQQWREMLVQSMKTSAHAGSLPGSLRRRLKAAITRSIPWQQLLARFVQTQASGEREWYPPSRRHIHRGLYLPRQRIKFIELTIAIDTSGSCAQDFGKFLAQLNYLLNSYQRYEITVLQCDTRIVNVATYTPERPLNANNFEFSGFGGTRFQPVFDYVQHHPTAALIYFTDGYACDPVNNADVPVLWVLTSDGMEEMDSGESIRMN
ncbi:DUF2201 family putative metallopeptidase [Pseudidiomarina insulisalsae]|uniref:Metallopeptidase domain-containing protein n=1 Tax=Pseudidiomarina insulisalsae TaxID=575789 RepID=A0A432YMJ8_9GAMM|nr:VWA-like domain-containing protein [Pseudidiomarina insulisalsae]RUO62207.1 hypothetical protein CWI71_04985 [Pseudidiomarina insulisalsae]